MASKNIVAKGTTYNGVESVTLPVSGGGDATFYEISDTTAGASDVASGKYFYTALGVLTQGTASGGGSTGLVYESGTWTPSEDIARPTITFTNQHSDIPMLIMMVDATGTDDQTQSTNYGFSYTAFNAFSNAVPSNITTNCRYGLASYVYRTSSNPAQGISAVTLISGSKASAEPYWVTASEFYPSSASDTRYWRTSRTYKWIAVWAPTT